MLQTVEAEIDVNGNVHLLEPLKITKTSRVLATLLDEEVKTIKETPSKGEGNVSAVLEFLRTHRLPEEARPSVEDMEAQITENRNSWD
jgi:hypothetical protein